MTVDLSPWWLLAAAAPVLLMGEVVVRAVPVLGRFHIPAAVIGGLLVALAVLAANVIGGATITLHSQITAPADFDHLTAGDRFRVAWTWLGSVETQWPRVPPQQVHLPIMIAFFTCIGLSASWSVVRAGGRPMLIFLAIATVFCILQTTLGIAIAKAMNASPYLGVLCGGLPLTGGLGTVFGFAPLFEEAGFDAARTVGAAAFTFGLVTGGLLSGPIGGYLIQRYRLKPGTAPAPGKSSTAPAPPPHGLIHDLRSLLQLGRPVLVLIAVILVCIKAGAWVSYGLEQVDLKFPAQMGAMIAGIILRNGLDLAGSRLIDPDAVRLLTSALLGLFLAMAMSSLDLTQLLHNGGPMLVILLAQVALMAGFALLVTFRLMGRDYRAALVASGHTGFGLGITPNALASMELLTNRFGPCPQAFLIVTFVGAFLIDIANSLTITAFLNFLR